MQALAIEGAVLEVLRTRGPATTHPDPSVTVVEEGCRNGNSRLLGRREFDQRTGLFVELRARSSQRNSSQLVWVGEAYQDLHTYHVSKYLPTHFSEFSGFSLFSPSSCARNLEIGTIRPRPGSATVENGARRVIAAVL